jgi:uncharacterized membrane protein
MGEKLVLALEYLLESPIFFTKVNPFLCISPQLAVARAH